MGLRYGLIFSAFGAYFFHSLYRSTTPTGSKFIAYCSCAPFAVRTVDSLLQASLPSFKAIFHCLVGSKDCMTKMFLWDVHTGVWD